MIDERVITTVQLFRLETQPASLTRTKRTSSVRQTASRLGLRGRQREKVAPIEHREKETHTERKRKSAMENLFADNDRNQVTAASAAI